MPLTPDQLRSQFQSLSGAVHETITDLKFQLLQSQAETARLKLKVGHLEEDIKVLNEQLKPPTIPDELFEEASVTEQFARRPA